MRDENGKGMWAGEECISLIFVKKKRKERGERVRTVLIAQYHTRTNSMAIAIAAESIMNVQTPNEGEKRDLVVIIH
jgi:hypothetical protein